MIRINLLAVDRHRRKKTGWFDPAARVTTACILVLVGTGVALGAWALALNRQSATLDEQLANTSAQARRLHSVIQQVQKFEQQRSELQERVALIEQLRQGQSGAVHLLDEVSRSLPDMLWLTEMKQTGDIVTIEGRCVSLTGLSDLVSHLESSPYFKKPVELVGSQTQPATAGQPEELIKFTIKAEYAPPQS
ncbi:MAG TPA: PilN domain-containing protein [Vicinamibacterales bacterium]|jgi:type IV pilus assembly protein PilN